MAVYKQTYDLYYELKELLAQKKQFIVNKKIEDMNKTDDLITISCNKIAKLNVSEISLNFSVEQKQELKKLGEDIKKLQNDNELLIKHSLGVMNKLLSGILNVVQADKTSYNAKGNFCQNTQGSDLSSFTEEA